MSIALGNQRNLVSSPYDSRFRLIFQEKLLQKKEGTVKLKS